MGLSLGDLTLGLEADVNALKKAQKNLRDFAKRVDSLVTSLDKVTRKENAFVRQERAIRSAREAMLSLNAAVKRTGGQSVLIAQNTRAFNSLQKAMRAGKLEAIDYARAQDRFRSSLNNTRRSLADLRQKQIAASNTKMNQFIKNMTSASVLAVGPLSGLGARIAAIGAISSRASLKMAAMFAAISGGIVILTKLATGAIQAKRDMDALDATLFAATGSVSAAKDEFKFLVKVSKRLGLDVRSLSKDYAKFSVAAAAGGLSAEQIRESFIGISTAGVALKLTNEQIAGTFKAATDVMSKGTVQAEEIKGQFGDRIPGAFSKAANAVNLTTQSFGRMLKQGKIISKDFIPLFTNQLLTDFAPAAEIASRSIDGELRRLSTSFFLLQISINEATNASGVYKTFIIALRKGIEGVVDILPQLIIGLSVLSGALVGLALPKIIAGFLFLSKAILAASGATLLFSKNITKLSGKKLIGSVIKLALAVLGGAAAWKLATDSADEFQAAMDRVIKALKGQMDAKEIPESISKAIKAASFDLKVLKSDVVVADDAMIAFLKSNQQLGEGPNALFGISKNFTFLKDELVTLNDIFVELRSRQDLKKLAESVRTPLEKFKRQLQELESLRSFAKIKLEGDALVKALADIEKAQLSLNKEYVKSSTIAGQAGQVIARSLEDAILDAKDFISVIRDLGRELERLIVRKAVTAPLGDVFGQVLNNILPGISPAQKSPPRIDSRPIPTTSRATAAKGAVFNQFGMSAFAKGGIVNSPTVFPFAKGTGLMGEAGPEGILPLKRMPGGDLGVQASGGGGGGRVSIQIIDQRGSGAPPVETSQSTGPDGGRILKVLIKSEVNALFNNGGLDSSLSRNFGLGRRGR